MQRLDTITVHDGTSTKTIELCCGDLTDLSSDEAIDILVVSAFPYDYLPLHGTLIGALDQRGVSVRQLAKSKLADLRETHSCWISHEITRRPPGIQFRRLLCFEPAVRGEPPEVVGDVFRSLVPFLGENPSVKSSSAGIFGSLGKIFGGRRSSTASSVAMPLVACGDQGVSVAKMLLPLLDAAVRWMSLPEFPLRLLKIAAYSPDKAQEAKALFASAKQRYEQQPVLNRPGDRYDVFISYARTNVREVGKALETLRQARPGLRIFHDQMSIKPGTAWQQEIYEAIEHCRVFVPFYSPDYLRSKVCLEEFHLARFCHRESGVSALFPIYLHTTELPAYIRMLNYMDCREADAEKLREACAKLAQTC